MTHRYEDMLLNLGNPRDTADLLQWISDPKSEIDQDYFINQLTDKYHKQFYNHYYLTSKLNDIIETNVFIFLNIIHILTKGNPVEIIELKQNQQYRNIIKNKDLIKILNDEEVSYHVKKAFLPSISLLKNTHVENKEITSMTDYTFKLVNLELDQLKEENKELKRKLDELYEMVMWHPDGPGAKVVEEHARELAYPSKN